MTHIRFFTISLLLLLVIFTGCGKSKVPGLVPATGEVIFNGTPIEGVSLTFTPIDFQDGNRVAVGKTDAQGRFDLSTIGEKGVLPNKYVVSLVKNEIVPPSQSETNQPTRPEPRKIRPVIPARYNDRKTSQIEIEIGNDGNKTIRIELNENDNPRH